MIKVYKTKQKIISFLKVDKGLQDQADGVKLMKDIPNLVEQCQEAVRKNVFGTKMRSVIYEANPKGIEEIASFKIVDEEKWVSPDFSKGESFDPYQEYTHHVCFYDENGKQIGVSPEIAALYLHTQDADVPSLFKIEEADDLFYETYDLYNTFSEKYFDTDSLKTLTFLANASGLSTDNFGNAYFGKNNFFLKS